MAADANAPQAGRDASSTGAEGAACITFGPFENARTLVASPNLSNTQVEDNIVQRYDLTKVANEPIADRDYDDPYPGGPTSTLGVPGDG